MVLLGLAVAGSAAGRLGTMRPIITAAGRAVLQLGVVAVVISAVLTGLVWSLLFAGLMFAVAVVTTSRRVGAPRAWPWAALALATGVVPVLLVIFGTRSVPFTGASLVPFAGIVIGGAMNAHSLAGRRAFAALRDQHGSYEPKPSPSPSPTNSSAPPGCYPQTCPHPCSPNQIWADAARPDK